MDPVELEIAVNALFEEVLKEVFGAVENGGGFGVNVLFVDAPSGEAGYPLVEKVDRLMAERLPAKAPGCTLTFEQTSLVKDPVIRGPRGEEWVYRVFEVMGQTSWSLQRRMDI